MDISAVIGDNLRRIRLERNLSLGKLSEICSVSKVMLSQIEKGASNPSVNTVWKIADALGVPYTALLEKNVDGGVVVSGSDVQVQQLDEGKGELRCYYHHTSGRIFELFRMTVFAGCVYTSQGHGERTDEYTLVIKGDLTITLDDGDHVLHAGDALSFHSDKKHSYANTGDAPLELVIINYYR